MPAPRAGRPDGPGLTDTRRRPRPGGICGRAGRSARSGYRAELRKDRTQAFGLPRSGAIEARSDRVLPLREAGPPGRGGQRARAADLRKRRQQVEGRQAAAGVVPDLRQKESTADRRRAPRPVPYSEPLRTGWCIP
ncbi:hypothetical protein GCM10020295_74380 [Streptomyces cinereospinus]